MNAELIQPNHFAALRAQGVPEAQVAALEAIVLELADAAHSAYSAIREVEMAAQDNRHLYATNARWNLAMACSLAGFPIQDQT